MMMIGVATEIDSMIGRDAIVTNLLVVVEVPASVFASTSSHQGDAATVRVAGFLTKMAATENQPLIAQMIDAVTLKMEGVKMENSVPRKDFEVLIAAACNLAPTMLHQPLRAGGLAAVHI
jgi:hypothetical protein